MKKNTRIFHLLFDIFVIAYQKKSWIFQSTYSGLEHGGTIELFVDSNWFQTTKLLLKVNIIKSWFNLTDQNFMSVYRYKVPQSMTDWNLDNIGRYWRKDIGSRIDMKEDWKALSGNSDIWARVGSNHRKGMLFTTKEEPERKEKDKIKVMHAR